MWLKRAKYVKKRVLEERGEVVPCKAYVRGF